VGKRPLGFTNDAVAHKKDDDPFAEVRPEDLHKFGLIPEFIGRLPMIASVAPLDKEALVRILLEPRNALVKQFRKLFELDGVELELSPDAIDAIADLALNRGTGARGLRAIIEEALLNVMFEVPSSDDIVSVLVTGECIRDGVEPTLVTRASRREKSA
jgi:ATP-dependent Clp protease ATP-binding subunit ClpX